MYVQVVTFNLKDIDEAAFRGVADQDAPTFGAMPRLVAKYWLADSETNTYGGVYIWESREALDEYLNGEVWAAVKGNPHLENVTSREYGTLEGPTKVTRGIAAMSAAR
jgi:hypothetical protein